MNEIQKKSLIISIVLGMEYYLLVIYPDLFRIFFTLVMVTVLGFCSYYFNLKLAWGELRDKYRFLILPILYNFGFTFYVISLFQAPAKIVFSFLATIGNYYLFIALKKVQHLEDRAAIFHRNVLISLSFLTLLLSLSTIYRWQVLLSTSAFFPYLPVLIVVLVALIFYFISYFLAWENGINLKKFLPYNLVFSFLSAQIALVSVVWVVNYPVISSYERANLGGLPLPAVFLTIIFYFIWGIISHKMDKSLTRKVMSEYIVITLLFLLILLSTAKWLPLI